MPELRLHLAAPNSGLGRMLESAGAGPPYWAYAWAGGLALARYVLDRRAMVRGRRVLDLGAGSGLIAIAAALAGAAEVTAAEIDPLGRTAIALNAAVNGVTVAIRGEDLTAGAPPDVDLILAGDVFYDEAVAARMLPFLRRCAAAGVEVLVGDPDRRPLPRTALIRVAALQVADMDQAQIQAGVFKLARTE